MARRYYSNVTTAGTLSSPVGSADTVISVGGLSSLPTVPFTAVISKGTSSEEVVLVTAVAGPALTVTRAYDGTLGSSHTAGATLEHALVAEGPNRWDSHSEATSGVHGVVGDFVGTSQAQTLTNKTITDSTYTGRGSGSPGSGAEFTAIVDVEARPGFIADTTSTAANGTGFAVQQGGVNRFRAKADGSVVISPSGSPAQALSVTGPTALSGNTAVTGTLGATGAATVGSLASAGAVSGTTGTFTGNVSGVDAGFANGTFTGNVSVAGSVTVGNDVSIADDLTVLGDANVTGPITAGPATFGATTVNGNATVNGTTTTASAAVTGGITTHGSTLSTSVLEANAHQAWIGQIRDSANNVTSRSLRQPVTHYAAGTIANVKPQGTEVQLFNKVFKARESCNPILGVFLNLFCDQGGAAAADAGQTDLRFRVVRVNDGAVLYDSGLGKRVVYGIVSNNGFRPRRHFECKFPLPITLVAGTDYRLEVNGQSDGTGTADLVYQGYEATLIEGVVVAV